MSKLVKLCSLGLILSSLALSSGCATITKEALKNFKPEHRKEYRDGLEDATNAYDGLYDRDGMPIEE